MLLIRGALALLLAAQDTTAERVVIDVRIGRITNATVQAYRVGTEVLLPLSRFFELAEIRSHLTADGRLEATLEPGNRRVVIDARSDTLRMLRFTAGELYLGSERLGDLLRVRFVIDWADLTATVVDPATLPIAIRLRRDALRESFLRHTNGIPADVTLGQEHPTWGGVVLDYSLLAPSTDPLAHASYGLGLGADVGGGSLEMVARGVGNNVDGSDRWHLNGSWTGVWRERRWLKQLRLGDVIGTGPRGRALRGVALTNAPFVRPTLVGSLRYGGTLEPGWSVEAYRGGELVGFDSTTTTGEFAVDLPVLYGENPVDFVAYGPFGEVRQFNRTYRVLFERLPARQFEYGLSGGRCPEPALACSGTGNVDLRYGLTRWWTVQGGVEQFWRDSLGDRSYPYASVSGNPSSDWGIESELIGGALVRGALRYEPSVDLRLEGEYVNFADDIAPVLTAPGRQSQWSLIGFLRPATDQGLFFLEGRVEQIRTDAGTLTRSRLGASLQTDQIRLLPYVRTEGGREFAGVGTFIMPRPQWSRFLSQTLFRTTTEIERSAALSFWSVFAAHSIVPAIRLEVGATWRRGLPAPTYTLTATTYFSAMRAVTFVAAQALQPVLGTQFIQGAVLWDDHASRLGVSPGPALQRSGLSGRVFVDQNADGLYDPGERTLANVRVQVGSRTARSDSSGTYHVWDLVPFEPVIVTIDSLSLESPLEVPLFARTSIVPGPNRYRSLDIPIIEAGVVEGRVMREGRGVGGVTLILLDRRQNTQRTLTTFNDGGFYLMGVKPGDYLLFVPVPVLDALQANGEPLLFTVTPGGTGRSGLEVRLTPRN